MNIDEMIASLEPDRSGFFMPAEWEKHERIWMGWPQRPDVWRDKAGPGMQAFVQVCACSACSTSPSERPALACMSPLVANVIHCQGTSFAQVAEAISKFEYVMVGANEEQVRS